MKKIFAFIILGAVGAVFVFLVPFILRSFYAGTGAAAFDYKPSDMLVYSGSILAGVATIIGVLVSILYSQRGYKEDARRNVLPYLSLAHKSSVINITDGSWEKVIREMEKDRLEYHFAYVDEGIQANYRETREGIGRGREPKILSLFALESIGNRAAIGCTLQMEGPAGTKGNPLHLNHCTDKKTIVILWNMARQENRAAFKIVFRYYDLYHNLYEQVFMFDLSRWEEHIGFDIPHEQALVERGRY